MSLTKFFHSQVIFVKGDFMSAIIIILVVLVIWQVLKHSEHSYDAESPMSPEELNPFRLAEKNGFARVRLTISNEYRVPIKSFVAFDVETANAQPFSICSISAVKVENGKIVDSISSLIKPPETKFTNTWVHGIKWKDVRTSPMFKEFYESTFHNFINGHVLVAHNAQFDVGCLVQTAKAEKIKLDHPLLFADTLQSARYAYKNLPNHKLDTICNLLKIPLNHHDSLSDSTACAKIMLDTMSKGVIPIVKSLYGSSEDLFVKSVLYGAKCYPGGVSYESLYKEKPEGYTADDFIHDFVNPGKYAKLVDASDELALQKMRKKELQEILSRAGLPTTGLKKDLISVILKNGLAPKLPPNHIHQYKF